MSGQAPDLTRIWLEKVRAYYAKYKGIYENSVAWHYHQTRRGRAAGEPPTPPSFTLDFEDLGVTDAFRGVKTPAEKQEEIEALNHFMRDVHNVLIRCRYDAQLKHGPRPVPRLFIQVKK